MRKVLIVPIGAYKGRVMTAIKARKPEEIYLLIAKTNGDWPNRTKLDAKEIMENLTKTGMYDKKDFKEVSVNFNDPADIFESLGKIINNLGENTEIWIDLTSTTRFALIWLERFGDMYDNIKYFIIPGSKNKPYPDEITNDPGLDPRDIPKMATNIRRLLIQKKIKQREVLKLINNENPIEQARLLDKIKWEDFRIKRSAMTLTRILRDLEGWGCIKIEEKDRINIITITEFGRALVKVI